MSSSDERRGPYQPMMSEARARQLRAWHDAAYARDERHTDITMTYLGLELVVPPQVHPPQRMSRLLGAAVLDEVRGSDRVLDMGTGSGVNAILAASKSADVVAVDVNPYSTVCARQNAQRNGVAARVDAHESDLFETVDGTFDLIIFDPPFRWFAPRDLRERATADENYETLTAFFRDVQRFLSRGGRILVFFGTSGDADYLAHLIDAAGFQTADVATEDLAKDGQTVTYFTRRLTT